MNRSTKSKHQVRLDVVRYDEQISIYFKYFLQKYSMFRYLLIVRKVY